MVSDLFEKILEYDKRNKLKIKQKSQRFVYGEINKHIDDFYTLKNIPNLIFIIGLRGVGKTTILNTILSERSAFYTSGDFLFNQNINLNDFFETIKTLNTKIIIIDEIQYLDWQISVKLFADLNPDKLIIISGSSSINISRVGIDLIRRAKTFVVDPLSFREYLLIKNNIKVDFNNKLKNIIFSKDSLQQKYFDLIKFEGHLSKEIIEEFNNYLLSSFPYMLEKYDKKVIQDIINKVIYEDIPKIESFNTDNLDIIKKILNFLIINEKTSITTITKVTGSSKSLIFKFINLLEKAKLIDYVEPSVTTKRLGDAKRYVFYTPNFRFALTNTEQEIVKGFSKEDLFVRIIRSLDKGIKYFYEENKNDFIVDNIIFEIGSKNKKVYKKGVIVVYSGELRFDGNNLYVPIALFSLIN